jgi:hypothetical protein
MVAKKEESKKKTEREPVVETQAGTKKEAAKPVDMNEDQRAEWNQRTKEINGLLNRGYWDKAKAQIDDLPNYGFEGLKQAKEELIKELAASKRRDADRKKAEEKEAKDPNRVTMESVENKLFSLSADVDLLTKSRARAGKPNRQLTVLKRRLDTLLLFYTKFHKGSRD